MLRNPEDIVQSIIGDITIMKNEIPKQEYFSTNRARKELTVEKSSFPEDCSEISMSNEVGGRMSNSF